jgi:hypothetical protein
LLLRTHMRLVPDKPHLRPCPSEKLREISQKSSQDEEFVLLQSDKYFRHHAVTQTMRQFTYYT